MSSNEQFVDFYEALEISPNAQTETIARVYRLLAQRYHPDNLETGDAARFGLIFQANRVLGDPELRARYDIQHRQHLQLKWQIFDTKTAASGADSEKERRFGILSILYTKRSQDLINSTVALHDFESMLGVPREHLEFSMWYLRERGMLTRGDNGSCQITVLGVDYLEENGLQERFEGVLRLRAAGGDRR